MAANNLSGPQSSKKPRKYAKGQSLTANHLNQTLRAVYQIFVPGAGIRIQRLGNKAVISATGGAGLVGGSGNARWNTADTEAALPVVDAPALGYTLDTARAYMRLGTSWIKVLIMGTGTISSVGSSPSTGSSDSPAPFDHVHAGAYEVAGKTYSESGLLLSHFE